MLLVESARKARMLVDCLRGAVHELERTQGRNLSKWRYGNYLQWRLNHPVGSRLPGLASLFDIGPVPVSGGSTEVKQTTMRIGPSERYIAVVGGWDKSVVERCCRRLKQERNHEFNEEQDRIEIFPK